MEQKGTEDENEDTFDGKVEAEHRHDLDG